MVAIIGMFALLTFAIAAIARRGYRTTALVVGSIPAAVVALENLAELLNPLSWFVLLPIWLVFVAAALVGAWLARLLNERRRRA